MTTQPTHAPGKGSDKQHPETPPDANEKFREAEKRELEEQQKKSHDSSVHHKN